MQAVICCKHRSNEATLAAIQLAQFLRSLQWNVQLVSYTPLAGRKGEPHRDGVVFRRQLPGVSEQSLVIWVGEVSPDWVMEAALQSRTQLWIPDQLALQTQAHLAELMHAVLFTHARAVHLARQRLRHTACRLRVVPWPALPQGWQWYPRTQARPVLDLSCGQYAHTSVVAVRALCCWRQQTRATATVLYDNDRSYFQKSLLKCVSDSGVRVVLIQDAMQRQIEYAKHNIWLCFHTEPLIGCQIRQAQACGLLPISPSTCLELTRACLRWQKPSRPDGCGDTTSEKDHAVHQAQLAAKLHRAQQLLGDWESDVKDILTETHMTCVAYWRTWQAEKREKAYGETDTETGA